MASGFPLAVWLLFASHFFWFHSTWARAPTLDQYSAHKTCTLTRHVFDFPIAIAHTESTTSPTIDLPDFHSFLSCVSCTHTHTISDAFHFFSVCVECYVCLFLLSLLLLLWKLHFFVCELLCILEMDQFTSNWPSTRESVAPNAQITATTTTTITKKMVKISLKIHRKLFGERSHFMPNTYLPRAHKISSNEKTE